MTSADLGAARDRLQSLLLNRALDLLDVVNSRRRSVRIITLSDSESVLAGLCDLTSWLREPGSTPPSALFAHLSRSIPEALSRELARVKDRVLRLPLPPSSSRSSET